MANKAIHNMKELPKVWQSMNVCMIVATYALHKCTTHGIYHLIIFKEEQLPINHIMTKI